MATYRNRPHSLPDLLGSGGPSRGDSYSDAYGVVLGGAKHYGMADEGSYFTVLNTTPGTGMTGHAAPTTADPTKPLLWLFNGGSRRVYVDMVSVRVTLAGANGTHSDFSVFTDTGATRASGGTQVTPQNVNSDVATPAGVTAYIGATVLVNSSAKHIAHRRVRSEISLVQDHYHFAFGYGGYGLPSVLAPTGGAILEAHIAFPPVVIGPGDSFIFVQWAAVQDTAGTFDVEAAYIER